MNVFHIQFNIPTDSSPWVILANIMSARSSLCYLDITVNCNDQDSAWQLIQELKPDWSREDLQEKSFSNGLINQMTCYYLKADEYMLDALVIRVCTTSYGDSETREKEFLTAQIAHAAGCFPRIYASFNNGFVYQYAIGRNPNFHDITKPEFIRKYAHKLYDFHNYEEENLALKNLRGMPATYSPVPITIEERGAVNLIPDHPDASCGLHPEGIAKFRHYRREFTKDYLVKEFKYIQSILDEISLPVSLCHMDLHPHNMLLDPATGDITFIDFEFSGYHYTYYDLAYLFSMQLALRNMGLIGPDEPAFTDEHRSMCLREYLYAKYKAKGIGSEAISDEEFELFDIQHRIIETLITLQHIPFFLAFAFVLKNASLFDHIPGSKEKYLADKKLLPVLLDRCKHLIDSLNHGSSGWHLICVIFKLILVTDILCISCSL